MKRKNLIFMVVVGVFALAIYGCSQLGDKTSTTIAGPTDNPGVDSLALMLEQYKVVENTIAKMDRFVTINDDGTYTLDFQGFLSAEGKNLTSGEMNAANGLKDGIPIVNSLILQEQRKPGSTALGSACWRYWWGIRCCFWGSTASQIANGLQIGTITVLWFPLVGAVSGFTGSVLQACYNAWGGFCVNVSWGFPVVPPWITRP
ncbi:MAG: hypothetical protein PHY34_00480 [Patescibacteria group bacterium]|nr:hypothetical protein [Patescibacteria group bacterium]MDD5715895.1 hypothetical protein [Patescibacteria group bacterium]